MASRKASKKKTKLRGAFYGPSGAGKTMSLLRIATGLARFDNGGTIPEEGPGRIGVIDSEDGDSELYADRFDFNIIVLGRDTPDKTIDSYTKALKDAAEEGWSVAIIDSLSHAWRELLEQVDNAKRADRSGNKFQAWADATPKQKEFIETIKKFPGHVLVTMRASTVWDLVENDRGKKEPRRMGLAPEQGKGIEFEFTWLAFIDTDHSCRVEKDRTGKFQDVHYKLLDEAFGAELGAWLADGAKPVTEEQKQRIKDLCKQNGIGGKAFTEKFKAAPGTYERAEEIIEELLKSDPMKAASDAAERTLADAARPTPPPVDQQAGGERSSETDTSGGNSTHRTEVNPPPPKPATTRKTTTPAGGAPTDHETGFPLEGDHVGGGEKAPPDNVLDGGITEKLVLVKKKIDAQPSAPAVAIAIAELATVIEDLPKRPRMIARNYAAAVVKERNGADLTEDDKRAKQALDGIVGG